MKLFYRKLIFFNLLSLLAFQNAFSADAGDSKQQAEAEKDAHEQAIDAYFQDRENYLKEFEEVISSCGKNGLEMPFRDYPYLTNKHEGFGDGSEDHLIQAFEKVLELGFNASEARQYYLIRCLLDFALKKKFLKLIQFLLKNNIMSEREYLSTLLTGYLLDDNDEFLLHCFDALFKKYDKRDDKKIDLLIRIIDRYPAFGVRKPSTKQTLEAEKLRLKFINLLKRFQVKNYLSEIDKLIGPGSSPSNIRWNRIRAGLV